MEDHHKKVKKKDGTIRYDDVFHPLGIKMGKGKFEHIADAIGVGLALKTGNIAKMYIKRIGE